MQFTFPTPFFYFCFFFLFFFFFVVVRNAHRDCFAHLQAPAATEKAEAEPISVESLQCAEALRPILSRFLFFLFFTTFVIRSRDMRRNYVFSRSRLRRISWQKRSAGIKFFHAGSIMLYSWRRTAVLRHHARINVAAM